MHYALGVIQGTLGVIQGTLGVIQGTLGVMRNTLANASDYDDDDDNKNKPVWPTWAVGALFRSVRRIHINHVCENVCFHIPTMRQMGCPLIALLVVLAARRCGAVRVAIQEARSTEEEEVKLDLARY